MTVEQSCKLWEAGAPDGLGGNLELVLGYVYHSIAERSDGPAPGSAPVGAADAVRLAHLGARAPHVWFHRDGRSVSTLDHFGSELVLLAGCSGRAWRDAAERVSRRLHVPLRAFVVGSGQDLTDPSGTWCATYRVSQSGAVLVRPDGHIAWCSQQQSDSPAAELRHVLRRTLGRTDALRAEP